MSTSTPKAFRHAQFSQSFLAGIEELIYSMRVLRVSEYV
ncbi:hypothetical protein CDS [Bradyrhizobium sp.]|nr:hypothetical protein CDS [Bradyrhizobium sp.]